MKPRSLYIHVPFCARRCAYCDFAVEAVREPPVEEWIEAVGRELMLTAAEQSWERPLSLDTLYIGGGTPSLLGTGAMRKLRDVLRPHVSLETGAEWTCEANPESFTDELATDWRDTGVNRLSLGAQTFHAESLRWMGRLHGPDGPGRAVEAARRAGFDNVSIDLIFGLPERLGRKWGADIDQLLSLEPDHVSLYGLTAEEGTPLGRWVGDRRETLADEDRYADEYLLAADRFADAGFEHYEVSNFARGGKRSRHNFVYWTGEPYAALGSGAHSFFPPLRRWNHRSWSAYKEALAGGTLPYDGREIVDASSRALEEIWLGLRTTSGYPSSTLSSPAHALVDDWVAAGLASRTEKAVRLSPRGWLLLDRLATDLADVEAPGHERRAGDTIDDGERLVQISAHSNELIS